MVPPNDSTASDAASLSSSHCDSCDPARPGARNEKYGAGPSGYTCVNRHVRRPPPHTDCSAFSTAEVTPACRSSKRSHVTAVSKVSTMQPRETRASRPYGARRNDFFHAPTAPSFDELSDVCTPSGTVPPRSAQHSTARAIQASTGWSADSNPSTSNADPSPTPAEIIASPGSRSRQLVG